MALVLILVVALDFEGVRSVVGRGALGIGDGNLGSPGTLLSPSAPGSERHGPPLRALWVTCGNVSNAGLEELCSTSWERVVAAFASGEALVELAGGD